MARYDEIRKSYKELGAFGNVYDGIITRSTLLGELMDGLIWGLDAELSARLLGQSSRGAGGHGRADHAALRLAAEG